MTARSQSLVASPWCPIPYTFQCPDDAFPLPPDTLPYASLPVFDVSAVLCHHSNRKKLVLAVNWEFLQKTDEFARKPAYRQEVLSFPKVLTHIFMDESMETELDCWSIILRKES